MGISLPIGSHLDDAQARRTTRQAEDYFSTAGRRAGDEFSRQVNQGLGKVDTGKARIEAERLERAFDKAADAASKLRVEEAKLEDVQASGTATRAQLINHSERVERARRAEARATRDAVNALRDLENAGRLAEYAGGAMLSAADASAALGSSAAGAAGSVSKLAGALGPIAGGAAIGGAIVAGATAITLAIGAIGGSIAELSGLVGTLPGIFAGGAAAFGTLALATQGFSDAMGDIRDSKKFAEDLKELSPSAAQAATAIQQLMPSLDGLRFATSDALFAGMGPKLTQLANTYLPAVQQMTTSIASSFNSMFKAVGDQLMTPETQVAIQSAMANIGQAFQNLVPAIGPVTKAIADLVNVSSGFLPGFATAVANAATQFSNFLTNAAQTGELRQWIQDGVDALRKIVSLGPDLKQMFVDFKANGSTAISDVVELTRGLIRIIDELGGAYSRVSGSVKALANVAAQSFGLMEKSISMAMEPLRAMIDLNNKVNPLFKIEQLPRFGDVTAPFPEVGSNPFAPRVEGNAVPVPGAGGTWAPGSGGLGGAAGLTPGAPAVAPVFLPDAAQAGGGSKKTPLPTVPYGNQDPMSLLQGFPATASLYSAASSVLDNQQKVAQAKSDLNTLEKANVRDEDAITAKRNELARAQREEHESELRLTEAKQQAVQKSLKGMQTASGELQQLGVQLDKDFGISKGLGGIVENAVKALGNILAAPFLQALGFVAKANPNEGSGLVGIMAANGAFGSQYTPGAIAAAGQTGSVVPGGAYMPDVAGGAPSEAQVKAIAARFGLQVTSEDRPGDPGYHGSGMAIDFSNGTGNTAQMEAFANYLAQNFGSGLKELIYSSPTFTGNIKNGQPAPGTSVYDAGTLAQHQNHVHIAAQWGDASNALQGFTTAVTTATGALAGQPVTYGGGGDKGSIAKAIFGSVLGAGYSPATAMAAVQAGLLESGLNTSAQNQGHNSLFQTSADKGIASDPASQINWLLAEMSRQGGPAVANADPLNFFADRIERGGYPGSNYNQFLSQAQDLVGAGGPLPASGGAPLHPGLGPGNALPGVAPLGQVTPAVGGGTAYPSQGGNSGSLLGGLPLDGIMAATSGLDILAPGAGAAAKIGIQVANRTIGYAAQNAGILANGLLETFSVGDNPKGSLGAGWFGKLAGGIAGAGMALPNIAGKKAPEQQQGQQQGGNTYGDTNITVESRPGASGQEHGEQIAAEQGRMFAPAGRQ